MLLVALGAVSPELVEAVQRFRGRIYQADGAVVELTDGRHVEFADTSAYHVVLLREGGIAACLRYLRESRPDRPRVRIGGWAVAPELRGTRVAVRLALEAVRLARHFGDRSGIATATVRHNSAGILGRLGGRVLARYWDAAYGCEMERLEFTLEAMERRMPEAA